LRGLDSQSSVYKTVPHSIISIPYGDRDLLSENVIFCEQFDKAAIQSQRVRLSDPRLGQPRSDHDNSAGHCIWGHASLDPSAYHYGVLVVGCSRPRRERIASLRRRCHRASPCGRPDKPFPFSIEVLDHAELNAPILHDLAPSSVSRLTASLSGLFDFSRPLPALCSGIKTPKRLPAI